MTTVKYVFSKLTIKLIDKQSGTIHPYYEEKR